MKKTVSRALFPSQAVIANEHDARNRISHKRARSASLIPLVLLPTYLAGAQTNTQQVSKIVIRASRLLDVKGGRRLPDQNIFIEGDKITRIESGSLQVAPGWNLVDLSNASVLPEPIDCHIHLTISPSSFGYELLGSPEARQTLTGAPNARKSFPLSRLVVAQVLSMAVVSFALTLWQATVDSLTRFLTSFGGAQSFSEKALGLGKDVGCPALQACGAALCGAGGSTCTSAPLQIQGAKRPGRFLKSHKPVRASGFVLKQRNSARPLRG